MYLAVICYIRILNSYILCVFKSTKILSVLINALASLKNSNLSKYISSSLLCVFNPYFLVHFISIPLYFFHINFFFFLCCLRAYNPAVFSDLSSFFFNERNQCIHTQWWCLDNCASYTSQNFFFFFYFISCSFLFSIFLLVG